MRRRSKRHAAKLRRRHRRRRDLKFVVVAKNRNIFGVVVVVVRRGRPRSARAKAPSAPCCRRAFDTTLVRSRCEAAAPLPSRSEKSKFSAWPCVVVVVVVDHALRAQRPAPPRPSAAAPSIPRWFGHAAKPLRRCPVSKDEIRFSVTFCPWSWSWSWSWSTTPCARSPPSLSRVHERMIQPESMLKLGH